jgi:hypothetical protein
MRTIRKIAGGVQQLRCRLWCPYCQYGPDRGDEWNALSQEQRSAIVAARLCDG